MPRTRWRVTPRPSLRWRLGLLHHLQAGSPLVRKRPERASRSMIVAQFDGVPFMHWSYARDRLIEPSLPALALEIGGQP